MKKFFKYALISLVAVMATACAKDEVPMTSTVDLAGEWMMTAYVDDKAIYGPFMILTYNTNKDNGKEIWIDDLGNFWNPTTKAKVKCDLATLTFGATDVPVESGEITVTVTNGKVVFGGAKTPSDVVADAIEFDIEYSDDPGTVYTLKGYRRSGFVQDNE